MIRFDRQKAEAVGINCRRPLCDDRIFYSPRLRLTLSGRLRRPPRSLPFSAEKSAEQTRQTGLTPLLERPEYADYWALKWSGPAPKQPHRARRQRNVEFQRIGFAHSSAKTARWMQFVRDLLTAQGSTFTERTEQLLPRGKQSTGFGGNHQSSVSRHSDSVRQMPSSPVREVEPSRLLSVCRLFCACRHQK